MIRIFIASAFAVGFATSALGQGAVPTIKTEDQTNGNSGAVTVSVTPAAVAHASGNSIGGLITVPLARVNGGGGTIMSVLMTESWTGTIPLQVKIWQKSPASTTCTDNVAFAGNATDDLSLIGSGWFLLTPAAPLATTGDAKSYASLTGVGWNFKNTDTTASKNLYACIVETSGGENPGASAKLTLSLAGPTN